MATLSGIITPSNVLTASSTATLTNKTINGSNNTVTNIPLSTGVTGTLPVANGGTGATTLTANNVILGNGTSAVQAVAPGSNGNVLTSNGTTWASTAPAAAGFTLGTPIATTSGTAAEFTGLPAGVKQIVMSFSGVSFTGGVYPAVRLGTSGAYATTGYLSYGRQSIVDNSTLYEINATAQIALSSTAGGLGAADTFNGQLILTLLNSSTNLWVWSFSMGNSLGGAGFGAFGGGSITLSGAITRIQAIGGTFDAGSINIMYI